jgi:hypothetical protein
MPTTSAVASHPVLIGPHRGERRKQPSKPDEAVQSMVFHGDATRVGPEKFSRGPMTGPDVNLSLHPARAIARRLPLTTDYRVLRLSVDAI